MAWHRQTSLTNFIQQSPEFRRRLRSALSHELSVPRTRLSTYGDRACPVAAVRIWNSFPQLITSAPSLCTSSNSVTCNYCCRPREVTVIYAHVNRSYLLTYLLGDSFICVHLKVQRSDVKVTGSKRSYFNFHPSAWPAWVNMST